MSMMFECSDLTAPTKAKTFHKPTLKEVHPHSHHSHTFQQSQQAATWTTESDNLSKLFTVESKWLNSCFTNFIWKVKSFAVESKWQWIIVPIFNWEIVFQNPCQDKNLKPHQGGQLRLWSLTCLTGALTLTSFLNYTNMC